MEMDKKERECSPVTENDTTVRSKANLSSSRMQVVSRLEHSKLAQLLKWCFFSSILILLPWRFKQLLAPHLGSMESFSLSSLTVNQSLNPLVFQSIPLGSVRPLGWLEDEMNLMSDGLAGHEIDFYRVVRDSPWLGGGTEYSGLNEGLPYWFNGLVPLAYGTDNPRLKSQVDRVLEHVLNHQQDDGWLGPEQYEKRDIWGRFPMCLGLMQLVEADAAQAAKIVPAIHRYPDMIIVLQWLYENYPQDNKAMLLETMSLLDRNGLHWKSYYSKKNFIFADLDTVRPPINGDSGTFPFVHAVNAGQGLKSGAVLYRLNGDKSLLESTRNGVNWTMTYHGNAAGSIIGDERESGLASNRGSELCTTVETMYSLSYLYQALGDRDFADRCERAAFNALPAAFTQDHWGHQYLTVTNQPFSRKLEDPNPYWNTGVQSIMYGIEPNYPCCTVNFPQGLPKFLSASVVYSGSDGLAHALLSPVRAITKLPNGVAVNLTCDTAYPFDLTLNYQIVASAPFKFHLRVPSWASAYELILATSRSKQSPSSSNPPKTFNQDNLIPDPHTGMISVDLLQHTYITYILHTTLRTGSRANDTVAIYHGPLLYALDVGQDVKFDKLNSSNIDTTSPSFPAEHAHDYDITNTKEWRIAIDPSTLVYHGPSSSSSSSSSNDTSSSAPGFPEPAIADLASPIWDYEAPPGYVTVKTCEILWDLEKGTPSPVPEKGRRVCVKDSVGQRVLRPYGSLKVHMAELPVMDLSGE